MSALGIWFMRQLAPLPLPLLRALGVVFGWLLYGLAWPRRHVVATNLLLCFPKLDGVERRRLCRAHFVYFAQAWLDRAWLWHGSSAQLDARLRLCGEVAVLSQSDTPIVIFAPHFVGLDAGWTALTRAMDRHFVTIYTPQSNRTVDAWIRTGRAAQGQASLLQRGDGVKPIVQALRQGSPLYLLPDMNFGVEDSLFVPFYGVLAATVPSLPRFAKLGRAQVVPVITRMTDTGYSVEILSPWVNYPTQDLQTDTAMMNARLQTYIDTMPAQYYWVHKRFKSRPEGEESVY
jgi:Kdo2-lipid IVA lauroyltransferase/acyltransferase